MQLDHQLIAITGGLGDIGKAVALRLARDGAAILLIDRMPQAQGERIAKEIGVKIQYRYCDVTHLSEVEAVLSSIDKIDTVIVNAGIVRSGSFLQLSQQDWRETIDVNLTGAFYTAQAVAKKMVNQPFNKYNIRGRILFTGSWVQDMPYPGTFAYITSKGGLKMLAKTIAQELAPWGVLVNIVAPGAVKAGLTKQLYEKDDAFKARMVGAIPLEQLQTVESVAAAFAFLCSDDANYMTGSTLLIDGGLSLAKYSS